MMNYNNPNDPWLHTGYDPYKGINDADRMMSGCLQMSVVIGGIVIALLLCLLFSSCTTTQYVPVVEHKTDTLIVTKHQHDSIHVHDSIYVHEWTKGDTIFVESRKWLTKYVDHEVHDTTYISKTDSVPAPYPVETIKEVPTELTWWQQTRLYLANILLILAALAAVIYVGKRHIKSLLP